MATIVFALPILPGQEDVDREMLERLNAAGPEHDAYVSAAAPRPQARAGLAPGHARRHPCHHRARGGRPHERARGERHLGRSLSQTIPGVRQGLPGKFVKDVHGVDLANDPPPDVRLISDTRFRCFAGWGCGRREEAARQLESPQRRDGAKRARTADLLGAIQALSQLSYSPEGPIVPAGERSRPMAGARTRV